MLHGAATRMDPGLGEDQEAAPGTAPGCQVICGGVDTPAVPHPNMPPRCHSMGEPFYPSLNTTSKLSSTVSVPAYSRSSHSSGGVAQASLNDDEYWEEDFQTPHTLYAMWLGERRVAKVN